VTWIPAPTAEEIRAKDHERFLAESIFTDAASEDEVALVRALQAKRTADEIALALARLHLTRLPAPESLAEDTGPPLRRDDRIRTPLERSARPPNRVYEPSRTHDAAEIRPDASPPAREPHAPRPARDRNRAMVWFRVDIGRERNADPRWLLPLLCRAGNVTRSEIGSIKIFDRDTRFEVAEEFADSFAEAARSMKPNEGRISRLGAFSPDNAANGANAIGTPWHKGKNNARSHPNSRTSSPPKTSWRDRPHQKGDGQRPDHKTARPHSGPPKSKPGSKPVSKYAHKKKHRGAPKT
jgi:ATP-dependent RNA helicase DeaD